MLTTSMFARDQSTTARHDLRAHDRSLFINSNFHNQILPHRLRMGAPNLSARIDAGKLHIGRLGNKLEVVVVSAFTSVSCCQYTPSWASLDWPLSSQPAGEEVVPLTGTLWLCLRLCRFSRGQYTPSWVSPGWPLSSQPAGEEVATVWRGQLIE